jgi:predicted nucleic acid-binding protein
VVNAATRDRPELSGRLERTCQLMEVAVPDAIVDSYESLITTLDLPDPNDRHVLAAAIAGRADVIVTLNLKHFPRALSTGIISRHSIQMFSLCTS